MAITSTRLARPQQGELKSATIKPGRMRPMHTDEQGRQKADPALRLGLVQTRDKTPVKSRQLPESAYMRPRTSDDRFISYSQSAIAKLCVEE